VAIFSGLDGLAVTQPSVKAIKETENTDANVLQLLNMILKKHTKKTATAINCCHSDLAK